MCSWADIPMEGVKLRCWRLRSQGWLMDCSCLPPDFMRPRNPNRYEPRIFQTSGLLHCSSIGSRDSMGTPEEIQEALNLIPAKAGLVIVRGAGHELASARTIEDVTKTVVEAFWKFVV